MLIIAEEENTQYISTALTKNVVEKVAVIVVRLKSLIQSWSTLMIKKNIISVWSNQNIK